MSGSATADRVVGHYRILERLGRGGMGVVYKAEDLQLGRIVALKFLGRETTSDPESTQRFFNEARAASQLDHPNICTVHEISEDDDGQLFIVMSCYDGDNLETRIARGPMPVSEALDLALQIARGLAKAHQAGIIHRDIKPGNVIVTPDGTAKIVDFGLAKLSGVSVTQSGAAVGTVDYMSPEQLQGEAVSPATDVWSLGVLLFELLAGRRPFNGESIGSVIASIVHRDVPELCDVVSEMPAELNSLVCRMLRRDPRERYTSASDLLPDLEAVVAASGSARPHPGDISRLQTLVKSAARRRSPRLRAAIAILVIGFVLLSSALLFVGYRWRKEGLVSGRAGDRRAMIAVLPFDNLGAAEDRFFADGVTEEIISRLASVRELGVISRTSVYAYQREGRSVRDIGRDLGVDYVLEGTVRWEKTATRNRVRVTPQLIRVADDTHMWSDRYERDFSEVFAVQSDIAEQVTRQLGLALGSVSSVMAAPRNAEAYEDYLRAVPARWTYDEAEMRAGIAQAQQATQMDPRFAAAHALLGQLHVRMFHHFDRSPSRLALARASIDRSITIEPGNADARTALGYYYYWGNLDYGRAVDQWSAALANRPGDTSALAGIAYAHRRQGNFVQALLELQQLQRLDPRNKNVFAELGMTFAGLGRFDEGDALLERGLTIFPHDTFLQTIRFAIRLAGTGSLTDSRAILLSIPATDEETLVASWYALDICDRKFGDAVTRLRDSSVEWFVTSPTAGMWGTVRYPKALLIARAQQLAGDAAGARREYENARALLEKERDESPDDSRLHAAIGLTFAYLGLKQEAIREGELAVQLCPISKDAIDGSTRLAELAQILALTGEETRAVGVIERLLSRPAMFTPQLLRLDPVWDSLRDNSRFSALLQMPPLDQVAHRAAGT